MELKPYVLVHSDHDASLGGFRIFTLHKELNRNLSGNFTWQLKAVDVPADANPGLFLLNLMSGRGVFSGVKELDTIHTITISQECLIVEKASNPTVYSIIAPDFDSLPTGWKNHQGLSEIFRLYYNKREYLAKVRKYAESRNLSDAEQRQLMDSSFARANEVFVETAKKMKELTENPIVPSIPKPVGDMQVPIG